MDYLLGFLAFGAAVALGFWGARRFHIWYYNKQQRPPGWEEAFRFVWCRCYGQDWERRPRVAWIYGRKFIAGGQWVAGTSNPNAITIAWQPGMLLSDTAFTHELGHQVVGGNHDHPWFAPGGVVAQATAALKAMGQ